MQIQTLKLKPVAVALSVSLTIGGLFALGVPAFATTASNPTIVFDGNSISATIPATETATRVSADSLSVSTESLARTATTTRTGYTFGGWALTQGGAATTTITTTTTSDTTRTIYAVWNTTLTYNLNGADSGLPSGSATTTTYRFWNNLTLPTVGTMVKSGYAFGGWMGATVSTDRATTYTAAADAVGNPTLYAAWIKTVTFNSNTSTSGTIPISQVYTSGGTALKLPVLSEMTLRKTGYDFAGWSTTATGTPVSNPSSYVPLVSQQTLYAIWKVQTSKATARVFFNPGKSVLRSGQKLIIRDLVDSLRGKSSITISLAATHPRGTATALGKARNTAVVNYLNSLGVVATYTRTNTIGKGSLSTAEKNNRVTITANWANPTS
jgi:uncharacterized repeat protein (TIGR02543 family)